MPEYLPEPTLETDVVLNWMIANGRSCMAATGCPCLSVTAPEPMSRVGLAIPRMVVCLLVE